MDCKKAHVSLELGRKLIELHPELKDWVESKVPELKESNENIRLYMINMIKSIRYNNTVYGWFQDGKDEEMLNWLETHKEENTSDNPKPKFKVGDWITNGDKIEQISEIDNYYRCFNGNHGYGVYVMDIESTDADFHIWTIKDAKDGDTLTYYLDNGKALIFIYEGLGESYDGQVNCHALLDGDYFSESVGSVCCEFMELLIPSTKEQCDILFQRIHEEGYEWDAEKKELRKIGKQCEQIHTEWSEEDESMLTSCIGILGKCRMKELPNKVEEELTWLISLKDRIQPRLKQEWSKDDEKKIMWLVRLISTDGFRELDSDKMPCSRSELLDWLKSIKPQQKQEWTEEDERMLNLFLHKLEVCNLLSNNENTWIINKLKSINKTNGYPQKNEYNNNCKEDIEPKFMVGDTIRLKNSEAEYTITNIHDRCYNGKGWSLDIEKTDASDDWELVNPKQSCWKPTEEQMNAFRKLLDYNIGVFEYKSYMIVESLYEDLQKNTEK